MDPQTSLGTSLKEEKREGHLALVPQLQPLGLTNMVQTCTYGIKTMPQPHNEIHYLQELGKLPQLPDTEPEEGGRSMAELLTDLVPREKPRNFTAVSVISVKYQVSNVIDIKCSSVQL